MSSSLTRYDSLVETTATALARATAFARAMEPETPAVDQALGALRGLMAEAGSPYVLVSGVAVVHQGYLRTTRDLDVLVEEDAVARLSGRLERHGFEQSSPTRLRHRLSDVRVDLLVAGTAMPSSGDHLYPHPGEVARSAAEPDVVDLPPLVELKLAAGRHQDAADVVALVGPLSEDEYLRLEGAVRSELRPRLFELRRDALEERRQTD